MANDADINKLRAEVARLTRDLRTAERERVVLAAENVELRRRVPAPRKSRGNRGPTREQVEAEWRFILESSSSEDSDSDTSEEFTDRRAPVFVEDKDAPDGPLYSVFVDGSELFTSTDRRAARREFLKLMREYSHSQ